MSCEYHGICDCKCDEIAELKARIEYFEGDNKTLKSALDGAIERFYRQDCKIDELRAALAVAIETLKQIGEAEK